MRQIENNASPDALAIANIALVGALIERLVVNNAITKGDVRDIIDTARWAIGSRSDSVEGSEALKVIDTLRNHWT